MGAPETAEDDLVVGNWATLQPGIPESLTGILETIQSLVQALLAILNIALAILNVIKAFLVGFLNPLLALIEAIVSEIEAILQDIRQIGIYISGDLRIEGDQFETILGGFAAYERRMIGRLVNRSDPSRPAFSSRSAVIAIFLYASVDTTGIAALIKIIQKIMSFFGQTMAAKSFTAAVGLQATYGLDGATLASFGRLTDALNQGTVPNTVNLRWRMAPPPTGQTILFPRLAPKGFLIEISTVRAGLLLGYDTFVKNATVGEDNKPSRVYGLIRDPLTGGSFRLYGGKDMIDVTDMADPDFSPDTDGSDRETRLFAYRDTTDNIPIPLDTLKQGSKHLLQKTFFVRAGVFNVMGPGQGFSATLAAEDMPYEAVFEDDNGTIVATPEDNPATTVYARVSAVTEDIRDIVGQTGAVSDLDFYTLDSLDLASQVQGMGNAVLRVRDELTASDKSEASFPLTVTFPAADTAAYLETVTAALAVLVLSRSDLPIDSGVQEAQEALIAAQEALIAAQQAVIALGDDVPLADLEAAAEVAAEAQAALDAAQSATGFTTGVAILPTGLEEIGRWLVPHLIGNNMARYFDRNGILPESFRSDLLMRCRAFANDLYAKTGPLGEIEGLVVESGAALLEFRWSDVNTIFPNYTILESLAAMEDWEGVGLNPMSIGLGEAPTKYNVLFKTTITRAPAFLEKSTASPNRFQMNLGSADYSPIIYNRFPLRSLDLRFCRNVFTGDVYAAAAIALNIAAAPLTLSTSPEDGSWTAIRLFPQGLPALEQALEEIIGWVRTILTGIQGILDVITNYINFIIARILELQALINRINALLQSLLAFSMPQMTGLVVTANGTDGILQALVTAGDKPSDGTKAYGAGVVLLAGGLPAIAVEILQAFFPEAD